jgi:energy-coupling factor transporter transmembrane protein EcfT
MKVKRYNKKSLFIGFLILAFIALISAFFFYLPLVQQCAGCSGEGIIPAKITWRNHVAFFSFILVGVVILLITPLFGGLRDHERKILGIIYQRNGKLTRYSLANLLKIEKKRAWRVVQKFINFGYVELDKEKRIILTETGMNFIEK